MLRRSGSNSGLKANSHGSRSDAFAAIDALYTLEMQASLAAMHERRRSSRHQRAMTRLAERWPIAVGLVLSLFAPSLREIVEPFQPWGMWLVFPFVVIATRPEVFMGDKMAALMPQLMLYLQFPLEGFLAQAMLKGKVTVRAAFIQFLFFHILAIIEIWLVNGVLGQVLRR